MAAQLFAPNNTEKRKQEDDLKNEINEKVTKQKKYKRLSKCSEHVFQTCLFGGFLVYNSEFYETSFGSGSYFSEKLGEFWLEWRKSMDPEPHFLNAVHS